jgi:CRP-like cAMP-binding protein
MMVAGVIEGVAEGGRQRFRFSSRSVVGGLDSLAGRPRWFDATAVADTVAIRVPTSGLLDLFEDHVDMALDLLGVMAREVLGLRDKNAAVRLDAPAHPHGSPGA